MIRMEGGRELTQHRRRHDGAFNSMVVFEDTCGQKTIAE